MRYFWVILGLAALATALSSVTLIQMEERAVVFRFGRALPDQPRPGVHFFLPFGMDQVKREKVNLARSLKVGLPLVLNEDDKTTPPGQLLTGDHNLVNVQVTLEYSVIDERPEIERYVIMKDQVESLVTRAAENALAEWVAGRPIEEVLLNGKWQIPMWLRDAVSERIKPYELGIRLSSSPSVTLLYPREVKADFDRVAQAEQEKATRKNEAKQTATRYENQAKAIETAIRSEGRTFVENKHKLAQAEKTNIERDIELAAQNPYYVLVRWQNALARIYDKVQAHYVPPDTQLNITSFTGPNRKK